jgi:hypothetical protein
MEQMAIEVLGFLYMQEGSLTLASSAAFHC